MKSTQPWTRLPRPRRRDQRRQGPGTQPLVGISKDWRLITLQSSLTSRRVEGERGRRLPVAISHVEVAETFNLHLHIRTTRPRAIKRGWETEKSSDERRDETSKKDVRRENWQERTDKRRWLEEKILRYEAPRSREVRGHVEKVRVTVSGPTCDPTSPEGNNKLWRCGFCVAVG